MKIIYRIAVVLLSLMLGIANVFAQSHTEVVVERGEKWWGISSALSGRMPFTEPFGEIDLSTQGLSAPSSPLLISSYGRYIASKTPFKISFDGEKFIINSQSKVEVKDGGNNLRSAYVIALNNTLKPSGARPATELLSGTVYRVVGEDIDQSTIVGIATRAKVYGKRAGVISIGEQWQSYNGSMDFSVSQFTDPVAMVKELHSMGFTVIVDITPFISADSPAFRELEESGALLGGRTPKLIRWEAGYSAVLDTKSQAGRDWLNKKLESMRQHYGIDGFNFARGNMSYYEPSEALEQMEGWYDIAAANSMSMVSVGMGDIAGSPIQRMSGVESSWNGIREYISKVTTMGLSGYPFFSSLVYHPDSKYFSGELYIRWLQLSVFMPSVEIELMPWRELDSEQQQIIKNLTQIRATIVPYIEELVEESKKSGEPIIRTMEYNFPRKGFSDCEDQFMVGTDFIVAPIVDRESRRVVRLPQGVWISDRGEEVRGPVVMEVVAPIERIPYFTRKNR